MYYPRKRSYARKGKKSARRKIYKKRLPRKTSLVKTIKRVIHQQIENKVYTNYEANRIITTNTGSSAPTQFGLLPVLSQGTTVSTRIGNQVRIMKSVFRYKINMLPYNATTNPIGPMWIKMWVISLKNKSQFQGSPGASDYNNFFQVGSTNLNFQGYTLDTMFGVNKELFTVHTTRLHMLGSAQVAAGTNVSVGAGNPVASGAIYLDKYAKICKFNDAQTDVTNHSLWLVCQAVRTDGTIGTNELTSEIHYIHDIQYEDA